MANLKELVEEIRNVLGELHDDMNSLKVWLAIIEDRSHRSWMLWLAIIAPIVAAIAVVLMRK